MPNVIVETEAPIEVTVTDAGPGQLNVTVPSTITLDVINPATPSVEVSSVGAQGATGPAGTITSPVAQRIAFSQGLDGLANNVSTTPLTLTGFSGQTADLQQWRNNSGSPIARIDNVGQGIFAGINTQAPAGVVNTVRGPNDGSTPLFQVRHGNSIVVMSLNAQGGVTTKDIYATGSGGNAGITADVLSTSGTIMSLRNQGTVVQEVYNTGAKVHTIQSSSAIGYIIKAAASQTADLIQWQNSGGTAVARILSSGDLSSSSGAFTSNSSNGFVATIQGNLNTPARINVANIDAGNRYAFQIRRVDDSTNIYAVDNDGNTFARGNSISIQSEVTGANNANSILRIANTVFHKYIAGQQQFYYPTAMIPAVDTTPLLIRGFASTTQDLTQWQNSGGTILTKITSTGSIESPGTELKLRVTGDTFGAVNLRMLNRNGANGAIFQNETLDLVDFGFLPSSGVQGNIRWEHRSGNIISGSGNVGGEFQLISNNNTMLGFGTNSAFFTTQVFVNTLTASNIINANRSVTAIPGATGNPVYIATGLSGQTGNLFEGRTNGGSSVFGVGPTGNINMPVAGSTITLANSAGTTYPIGVNTNGKVTVAGTQIDNFGGSFSDFPIGYYMSSEVGTETSSSAGDNREYVIPFVVRRRTDGTLPTFDRLGIMITTAASGRTFRLGIRNSDKGVPSTVAIDGGELSAAATGWIESTISWAPTAPGLYFLVTRDSGTGARYSGLSSNTQNGGLPHGSAHRRGWWLSASPSAEGSAFNSDFRTGTINTDSDNAPAPRLRVAA